MSERPSPQRMLQDYLDSLLAPSLAVDEEGERQRKLEKLLSGLTPKVSPVRQDEVASSQSALQDDAWLANGRPSWAQESFDVLLFKVSGLSLAVPLVALGQIHPLDDRMTPLFGQVEWFMGLQPTPAGKIRTVNTALFVMPERYDAGFVKTARYVVSINGLAWGLAVDSVNQPIRLEPEDVKWRSERSNRPWLAGTVKAHMCALLDIATMGRLLAEADGSGTNPAVDYSKRK